MYNLDFETMRQVMQEHQKTGILHADLPSGVASMREPCRIEITIMAGTIVSCSIFAKSGNSLTGRKAVKEISRLGQLRWNFTSQEEIQEEMQGNTPGNPMSPALWQSSSPSHPTMMPPVSSSPSSPALPSQMSPAFPPSLETSLFPMRTTFLAQGQMRNWSRTHRAVFALADGTKNIEKIAAMLSISPATVYKAVMELQAIGVLIMGPQNRNDFYF